MARRPGSDMDHFNKWAGPSTFHHLTSSDSLQLQLEFGTVQGSRKSSQFKKQQTRAMATKEELGVAFSPGMSPCVEELYTLTLVHE